MRYRVITCYRKHKDNLPEDVYFRVEAIEDKDINKFRLASPRYEYTTEEEAIKSLENITNLFEEYLKDEGLATIDDYHQYFSISFRRHGTPAHLFEKSEIETAMRNADDRHNNQLVVDENGYVKIISDDEDGMLYPVRLECWSAGNNYVGKFSELYTLDEDYKYCLHGWLRYLMTGRKQYMDYLTEEIEEDSLISKIKEFYN